MADRSNHYERAFEVFLESKRVTCVPVVETRRMPIEDHPGESLKNLDFVIPRPGQPPLLVDVKGRRARRGIKSLQCWVTEDDLVSLERWERQFDTGSVGIFAFIYFLEQEEQKEEFADSLTFSDRHYGIMVAQRSDYQQKKRLRSPKWRTVDLSSSDFREIALPISRLLCAES